LAVFELLGHPLRWRLIRSLALSDRRVGELVAAGDERQNLVSYHLAQLRRGRLVTERRSSADGRDVYYSLDLARLQAELSESALALHPSLWTPAASGPWHGRSRRPSRVLFVCTGNSARSQMAEAILTDRGADSVEVRSAGPRPTTVHPLAARVLLSLGLSTEGLRSKSIDEVRAIEFDHVVTLCDVAREECPPLAGRPNRIHWSLPDPAQVEGRARDRLRAFERTAAELKTRISFALPVLATPKPESSAARASCARQQGIAVARAGCGQAPASAS
jgi:ArsR family transcriptional regulator, arsenate/arsenite/antimonite-responsive transcriptional repressor / arsenate reductase (thioredoxin)